MSSASVTGWSFRCRTASVQKNRGDSQTGRRRAVGIAAPPGETGGATWLRRRPPHYSGRWEKTYSRRHSGHRMKTLSSPSARISILVPQESHLLRSKIPRNQVAGAPFEPAALGAGALAPGVTSNRTVSEVCPTPPSPPVGETGAGIVACSPVKLRVPLFQNRVDLNLLPKSAGK